MQLVLMRSRVLFLVLCTSFPVPATFAADAQPRDVTSMVRDVAYVDDAESEQHMDVFWPPSQARATVLFIHGGSLQESGERRSSPVYRDVCRRFVSAGIACASMDYRLAPSHKWPAMPEDVVSAVVALRKLVQERGGDANRLFLFGHSSGCHLAAIVGTNPVYLGSKGLSPRDLAGVIAMGCTLDREDAALRGFTVETIRVPFARSADDVATFGSPENWLAANPAGFVGEHVPPFLVVVAEAERFMPPVLEQGSRFTRRLLENGVSADVVIVPGGHMSSIADIGKAGDPTFAAVKKFIDQPRSAAAH